MSSRLLPGTEFLSLERLEAIASTLEELAQSFADSADASSNLVEQAGHLRRQAEQIELHLRSEALLAAISSRLLNVPLASLEAGLHESLSELGRGAGVQRAYVFLLSDDGSVLADAYEWVEDGVVAHDFDTFRGVPVTAFPWSMEQFRRGETVIVSEPEALPEEAAPERGACEALTIASYVNMPLLLDQQVLGWLGFDSVGSSKAWTVSELKLMELARDVITSAIQRKRREELVFRQRELKQRVTSMGILAAGLAHEINNPLSFVAGNISFLDEVLTAVTVSDGRVLSDVRQTLKDCHEGTQRVQRIVGDLRGLANGEDSEVTSVDVEDVINSTLRMASNQIHHRARLLRNYAGVPPVMANTSQLGQLLLNLVLNAAGAIPEGHTPDNRIEVKAYGEGERVIIEIRDTGSGIPDEVLPRIFDPFYTTRDVGEGMGIGLAVCYNIVKRFGGEIEIASEVGVGTTVIVSLPRAPQERDREVAQERRPRVLLVDDEQRILDMMARFLRGHDLVFANNGREALDRIDQSSDFDLIVCDVMMPDMGGVDVYRAVRERRPGMEERIAFVTGGVLSREIEQFLRGLPNELLRKPFVPRQLRELVETAMRVA